MKNILVIGAGQLGSRHLQSLKAIPSERFNIYVIDPSNESLNIAKERATQIENENHKLYFLNDLKDLEVTQFYFCVIATTSNIRAQVTKDLLSNFTVENLLLEKILFNKDSQYSEIEKILEQSETRCWVNCCMRMQKIYSELSATLSGKKFTYNVTGSNFGNITNAIHYIDHACSIAQSTDFKTDFNGLEQELIESKRAGFFEINGHIRCQFPDNSIINITCFPEGSLPVLIEVNSSDSRFIFKENEDKYFIANSDTSWQWQEKDLGLLYQSQLTGILVENLINDKKVELPTFHESKSIHLSLLRPLKEHLTKCKKELEVDFPFT